MQLLSDVILVAVVTTAAVTDLKSGRIYNRLVYPAVVVGLLLALAVGGWAGLKDHALAAAIGFGVLFLCYAVGGMGGGDVKLMAAVGALGGMTRPEQGLFIVYVLFYAFAVGVVLGLLSAIWRRALGRTAAQTWWGLKVLAMPGTNLEDAAPKKSSIRVPFGFATGLGTIWVLAENYAGGTLGSLVSKLL